MNLVLIFDVRVRLFLGLRREGFRSHFLLFIFDTIMMAGLIACGVAGVVMMDGERFTTPPFYVASFLSATCVSIQW